MLVGAVALSFSPVFANLAHTGPTATGFYRMAFGGVGLLVLTLLRGRPLWSGRQSMLLILACGVFFALDLIFWHRSILHVGPGLATLLGNFQVFFLAGFGLLVLREPMTWRLAAAVPLAVVGLYLLVGRGWSTVPTSYRLGVLFGILTALSYSAYLLTLRRAQAREGARAAIGTVATLSICAAGILAITTPVLGESLVIPDASTLGVLLAYGAVAQVIGWVLIAVGIPGVAASRAGLVLLLQPALAFVWDMLLFGRPTSLWEGLGAVAALGAIYFGSFGGARKTPAVTRRTRD